MKGIELAPQVVGAEPFDGQRELEVLKAVRAKQPDENDLVPFRQVGEDEPSLFPAGWNRTHAEGVLQEERIHLPVGATNGQQLDRQQDQQRQKQPRQEAEPKQPLPARVVVDGRGFQRRKIVRVEGHELEPVRPAGTVDDVNPNRLDASSGHRDAKELSARRAVQHRHADLQVVAPLGDGRVQETPRVRAAVNTGSRANGKWNPSDPHGYGPPGPVKGSVIFKRCWTHLVLCRRSPTTRPTVDSTSAVGDTMTAIVPLAVACASGGAADSQSRPQKERLAALVSLGGLGRREAMGKLSLLKAAAKKEFKRLSRGGGGRKASRS